MKKLKLKLDYTEAARRVQMEPTLKTVGQRPDETTLSLYYPNGEHAATFPEVRTPEAGRKAAKTFMKYCKCEFEDLTKE